VPYCRNLPRLLGEDEANASRPIRNFGLLPQDPLQRHIIGTHHQPSSDLSSFTFSSSSNSYQVSFTPTQSITSLNNITNTKHFHTSHITMSSTTKPSTCCGRSGEGCVCAQEAKCSCGQKSAGQCNCEKAATENAAITGSACSCG